MPLKKSPSPETSPKKNPWSSLLLAFFLVMSVMLLYNFFGEHKEVETLSYNHFKTEIEEGMIRSITIDKDQVTALLRTPPGEKLRYHRTVIPPFQDKSFYALLDQHNVDIHVKSQKESAFWMALVSFLPWLLFLWLIFYFATRMRQQVGNVQGGLFNFMKSTAKKYEKRMSSIGYDDVAGLENAKKELAEVVDFLKNPQRYEAIGAQIPKGILLMGPPGTGKTLLAKAVAGEADVPFFSISGSEFVEVFVGVGASRVRDLFASAKKESPAIVFIDEIDSIGRARGAGIGGGYDEKEQTLNQILSELDGFEPNEQVVVMAATNRPDILDPALLRPGRFDRKITLSMPSKEAREKILQIHAKKIKKEDSVDLTKLAQLTVGFNGADLKNLVNEAAMYAARQQKEKVDQNDLLYARDRILMGIEQEFVMDEKDKKRVAVHEAGHALTALLLRHADPLEKVSIIPRGWALGATEQLPKKDMRNFPQSYLLDKIGVMLGGRASEKTLLDELSSGAANDLEEATALAVRMVCQWGMSDAIGPVHYKRGEEHVFLGREMALPKNFSDATAKLIDDEVRKLITQKEEEVIKLLNAHKKELILLAGELQERETMNKEEIETLLQRSEKETAVEKA
jgi:cell division protease FtsH